MFYFNHCCNTNRTAIFLTENGIEPQVLADESNGTDNIYNRIVLFWSCNCRVS